MARDPAGPQLEQLLAERGSSLMAAAIALSGSRQDAEDLLQAALERVLRKPRGIEDDVEGYLRLGNSCTTSPLDRRASSEPLTRPAFAGTTR